VPYPKPNFFANFGTEVPEYIAMESPCQWDQLLRPPTLLGVTA